MQLSPPAEPVTELGQHRWQILILSSIGMFMGTLLTTIVAVALPNHMAPDLQLTYSEALWVQAIYPLTMAICFIPVGRLAQKAGLLRFYLLGVAINGTFSIACGLAFSGPFLIAMRCLQATGGAIMAATSMALVTSVFPPHERGRGLGFNAMAGYLGLTVGPPLGGLIVGQWSWRWIFFINLPMVLLALVWGWFFLGAERRDRAALGEATSFRGGARLDLKGSALLGISLICLLVPLILVPFWGWTNPLTIGLIGGFVVFLVAFVLVERRVSDPVLDLNLIRHNRVFAAGTTAALLNYAAVFGVTTLTAAFLEIVEGLSARQAGLILLASPVFIVAFSPLFGRLSDRIGQRIPATGGMLLSAVGTLQLGLLPSPAPIWRIVLALSCVGLGMAAFSSPNSSSVMGAVKRTELSLASGFLGTMRTTGQAVSIGLLGAIAASSLGPIGGRVIFLGETASASAAESFAGGYRTAMLVAAGLAVAGAMVSLVRGPRAE